MNSEIYEIIRMLDDGNSELDDLIREIKDIHRQNTHDDDDIRKFIRELRMSLEVNE